MTTRLDPGPTTCPYVAAKHTYTPPLAKFPTYFYTLSCQLWLSLACRNSLNALPTK